MAPRKHDSAQALLAMMWGAGAGVLVVDAVSREQAGEQVTPWTWVIAGLCLVAAAATFAWDEIWRAMHPPMRFNPATLPRPFDWWEVDRRMSAFRDTDGAEDSPEELDSVYLTIRDTVTLEYVDVVREMLNGYDGTVSWCPSEPELGTDQSGRACFVSCKDSWKLDPPVVLPSPHRNELVLVDRIDAEAKLRADGPWRFTVLHGRAIDRGTGEVDEYRREFATPQGWPTCMDLARSSAPDSRPACAMRVAVRVSDVMGDLLAQPVEALVNPWNGTTCRGSCSGRMA
jgi:hypothetical protein